MNVYKPQDGIYQRQNRIRKVVGLIESKDDEKYIYVGTDGARRDNLS